ncbi:hypothetical protein [Paenarthrobacter sp. PH39-S1]|uniref:hypothetical protein n=1 Tax=Paenarthrobacter sp. PH39-S1 TaxID=3046204 RepID=UPI0024B97910|nr:hypothetical protein [Paenarthrobacter sp. PH39-S1]MDJ0356633.1 hypothetical protein [Paenarthrobacter sp. PH39-S1]
MHIPAQRLRSALIITLLVLNGVLWLTITASLLFYAMIVSAPFFGEQPTSMKLAESHRLLVWAVAVALVLPLAGLVGGAFLRSRSAVWTSAIMLVLGVATSAAIILWITTDAHRR